jgi:hypothetical protein
MVEVALQGGSDDSFLEVTLCISGTYTQEIPIWVNAGWRGALSVICGTKSSHMEVQKSAMHHNTLQPHHELDY